MISSHLRWDHHLTLVVTMDASWVGWDFTRQNLIPDALHKIVDWRVIGESDASESGDNNFYGCSGRSVARSTKVNKSQRTHVGLGYKFLNTSRFWYAQKPVILATQAHQVFYLDDPKNGSNWKVVQGIQNKCIWDVLEVDDVKNEHLNVLEIVVSHRVDDHIKDNTLCWTDVDPTIVERPVVRHVIDDFIDVVDEHTCKRRRWIIVMNHVSTYLCS